MADGGTPGTSPTTSKAKKKRPKVATPPTDRKKRQVRPGTLLAIIRNLMDENDIKPSDPITDLTDILEDTIIQEAME